MSDPLVSVVMGVKDGAEHLPACLESLISQTLDDWELVVVDDSSTDTTAEVLADYAARDGRIRVRTNPENLGLTKSLNLALGLVHGDFIARQDADDVSRPDRLARQVTFLRQDESVDVVGCWVEGGSDPAVPQTHWRTPERPLEVRYELLFGNCMAHPSVMLRRRLLDEGPLYDESVRYAQDFALWHRLTLRHSLANLPEPLYFRRQHEGQIGVRHGEAQETAVRAVLERRYAELLGTAEADQVVAMRRLERGEGLDASQARQLSALLGRLWRAFVAENVGMSASDAVLLRRRHARRLLRLAAHAVRCAPGTGLSTGVRALAYDPLAAFRVAVGRSS